MEVGFDCRIDVLIENIFCSGQSGRLRLGKCKGRWVSGGRVLSKLARAGQSSWRRFAMCREGKRMVLQCYQRGVRKLCIDKVPKNRKGVRFAGHSANSDIVIFSTPSPLSYFEAEVRAAEERDRNYSRPPGGTVFYGSSSIRSWQTLHQDFPGQSAINLGFGGSTFAACVTYFERLVVPRRPASLVLYAGENDMDDREDTSPILEDFHRMLVLVDGLPGKPHLTCISVKPTPVRQHRSAFVSQINAGIQEAVQRRSRSLFIDIGKVMTDQNGVPKPELYINDGIHLSSQGYAVWRAAILAHLSFVFPQSISSCN